MTIFLVVIVVVEISAFAVLMRGSFRRFRGRSFFGSNRPFSLLILISAVLLLPAFLNLASNVNAFTVKNGQVVALGTGEGLSDVVVVAQATFSITGIEGGSGGGGEIYRYTTLTDSGGRYSIPSAWSHAPVWIPPYFVTSAPAIHWTLRAYKVGYVNPVDGMNPELSPRHERFGRYASTPSALWLGFFSQIGQIELKPMDLNLIEASSYYSTVSAGVDGFSNLDPIFRLVKEKACAQEPLSSVDYWTVMDLRHLQPSDQAYMGKLYALEPEARDARVEDHPQFLAKDVCESLKAAG